MDICSGWKLKKSQGRWFETDVAAVDDNADASIKAIGGDAPTNAAGQDEAFFPHRIAGFVSESAVLRAAVAVNFSRANFLPE